MLLWPLGCSATDWPLPFCGFVGSCMSSDSKADNNSAGASSPIIGLCAGSRWSWIWARGNNGRFALLCGIKLTAKHKAYKTYAWFKFLVTAGWIKIAKFVGMENSTLKDVFRSSKATDCPSLIWKIKKCKHQAFAKQYILHHILSTKFKPVVFSVQVVYMSQMSELTARFCNIQQLIVTTEK